MSHTWLYGAVKPYFEQRGIKLLRDDMIFIENCLSSVPPERHRKIMRDYFSVWNTKIAVNDSVEPTRFNPRYEANTYLRNASGGKEGQPPLAS